MASISSQVIDQVITKLNASRPASIEEVKRCVLKPAQVAAGKKWIFVRTGLNQLARVGSDDSPINANELRVMVDAIAVGDATTPADLAVDPCVVWAAKQLDGQRLPNLSYELREVRRKPYYQMQGDYPLCRMELTYLAFHTSKTGDPETRA